MANHTIARPDYAVKQLIISIEADDKGDKFDVPFPSAALYLNHLLISYLEHLS